MSYCAVPASHQFPLPSSSCPQMPAVALMAHRPLTFSASSYLHNVCSVTILNLQLHILVLVAVMSIAKNLVLN